MSTWSAVERAWQTPDNRLWVDLLQPTPQDLDRLLAIFDLDPAVREDCLIGPARPRVDEYPRYLMLFVYGIRSTASTPTFSPRRLAIACGERFVITSHGEALLSVHAVAERCGRHGERLFQHGVDRLLYHLVDGLVDNYLVLIDAYDDEVGVLEEASVDAVSEVLLKDAARLRRDLMEVRRLSAAQESLLAPIVRGEFDYVSDQLGQEFRHVQDHLAHAVERVDGLRDRIAGAVGTYNATLAKRTNDIMRALTVCAALMLPLTLISGIYGMNVPVWPPADQPWSFWAILAVMAATAGGLVWFFRTRDWL